MIIRLYEPRYQHDLLAFIRRMWPQFPNKASSDYFEWAFDRNPLGSSLGTYLLLFEGEQIVGQMQTHRDRLWVNGEWCDCIWTSDLIIDPEHRGGLILRQVFRRAMRSARLILATGTQEVTEPLYDVLGWTRLPATRTLYRVLKPSGLISAAEGRGHELQIARPARYLLSMADRLLPFAQRLVVRSRESWSPTATVEVDRFDETWDSDITALVTQHEVTQQRSAALLNWKFRARPIGHNQLIVLRHDDGRLRGLVVLKWMAQPSGARWIEVADYLVAPGDNDGFEQLARGIVAAASLQNFDFVRFRLSLAEHVQALRRPLWVERTRPLRDTVFAFSQDRAIIETLSKSLWHLTALPADRADPGRDEWPGAVSCTSSSASLAHSLLR
jgi:hypothetical protein